MKHQNPFSLNKYINNKYFCGRRQETERIISAVTNQRNFCVFSEGGIGKTMLIKHIEAELAELENYRFYYVEIKTVESFSVFISVLLESIFYKKEIEKKIRRNFPEFRFITKTNKETNKTQILIKETEPNQEKLFAEIINFLKTKNVKIVFAIDDIENVLKYLKEHQVRILQKFITSSENISFILSTNNIKSIEFLLKDNFEQTEKIELQKIDKKKYAKFIQKKFMKGNRKIEKDVIEYILMWSKTTTFFTHYLCNKIFETEDKKITKKSVQKIIQNIFVEYESVFLNYKGLLSKYQWSLLMAIAEEGNALKITSADFIANYNLNAPSSVKTAVNALIDKGLVVRKGKSYHIINVFFEKWLSRY